MSILFMDGLDVYGNITDATRAGWAPSNNTSFQDLKTSLGRFSGSALWFAASNTSSSFTKAFPFATNKNYFISFDYMIDALPGSSGPSIIQVFPNNTSTRIFTLTLLQSGSIQITDANSTITAPSLTGVIAPSTWYRIEIKFNMGTSTSTGVVEVRVNGTLVSSVTGANLWQSGVGGAGIRIFNQSSSSNTAATYFDDFVINDDSGSINNDYLGDVRIDNVRPAADTAQADWTLSTGSDGYALIDDALSASADDDSGYVEGGTAGSKSEFTCSALSGTSANINAAQIRLRAERSDAGNRTYRGYLKSSSAVANGPTLAPEVGYVWDFNGIFETDPNTSAAWDDSGVNGVKLGLEVVS